MFFQSTWWLLNNSPQSLSFFIFLGKNDEEIAYQLGLDNSFAIFPRYVPYMRHYCPLSNYKLHPPKNMLIFIFYFIFELKFPHKKMKN